MFKNLLNMKTETFTFIPKNNMFTKLFLYTLKDLRLYYVKAHVVHLSVRLSVISKVLSAHLLQTYCT